jgi:radical SAM superfamily enzyme YgiQ (UPF0313 family)
VIDGLVRGLDNEILARQCTGADLVGVSCLSDYFPQVVDLCRHLKRRGLAVVIGGPHVTGDPNRALRSTGADFGIVGEGELSLLELAAAVGAGDQREAAEIPGVVTPRSDPTRLDLIGDLDSLPFPDWDQCPPASYPKAPHGGVARRYPIAPVTTTRGCPHSCTFCSSPTLWQRRVRFRSPQSVLDEIELMVTRYGVREVHFEDDNLTLKRSHVIAIAEGLLRRTISVSWSTPNGVRVESVDRELLQLMRSSGCYSVAFGIESADPEIRRRCGKETTIDRIEAAIAAASEVGMLTQGFFIFGLPGETAQTIEKTIAFASSSRLDKAQFLLLDLLPGSELWEQHGQQAPDRSTYQSFHDPGWCPEGLDPELLRKAPARALRAFFSRPRRVARMLGMIRPSQLPYLLRRAADFRILPRI